MREYSCCNTTMERMASNYIELIKGELSPLLYSILPSMKNIFPTISTCSTILNYYRSNIPFLYNPTREQKISSKLRWLVHLSSQMNPRKLQRKCRFYLSSNLHQKVRMDYALYRPGELCLPTSIILICK